MKQIQKVSSYIQTFLTLMLIAWPLLGFLKWAGYLPEAFCNWGYVKTPEGLVDLSNKELPFYSHLVCIVGNILEALPFFLGIFVVRKLFKNYKKNELFSLQNIGYFRQIGWLFFLDGILAAPLGGMLMVLGASLSNPPGHRFLSLTFGALNIEALACGCIIFVISWVMKEGYWLAEEQKLTI